MIIENGKASAMTMGDNSGIYKELDAPCLSPLEPQNNRREDEGDFGLC